MGAFNSDFDTVDLHRPTPAPAPAPAAVSHVDCASVAPKMTRVCPPSPVAMGPGCHGPNTAFTVQLKIK
jgi:hypothetical protein